MKRQTDDEDDDIWDYTATRKIRLTQNGLKPNKINSSNIAHPKRRKQSTTDSQNNESVRAKQNTRVRTKRSAKSTKDKGVKSKPSLSQTGKAIKNDICSQGFPQGCGSQVSSSQVEKTPAKSSQTPKRSQTPRSWERPPIPGACPNCQMPFQVLTIESPRWHVMECLDQPFIATQECPAGLFCDDTTPGHYRRFRHTLLANHRAGVSDGSSTEPGLETIFIPQQQSCAGVYSNQLFFHDSRAGTMTAVLDGFPSSTLNFDLCSQGCKSNVSSPRIPAESISSSAPTPPITPPSRIVVTKTEAAASLLKAEKLFLGSGSQEKRSDTLSHTKSPYFLKNCSTENTYNNNVSGKLKDPRKSASRNLFNSTPKKEQTSESFDIIVVKDDVECSEGESEQDIFGSHPNSLCDQDVGYLPDLEASENCTANLVQTHAASDPFMDGQQGTRIGQMKCEDVHALDKTESGLSDNVAQVSESMTSTEEFMKDVSDMLSDAYDDVPGQVGIKIKQESIPSCDNKTDEIVSVRHNYDAQEGPQLSEDEYETEILDINQEKTRTCDNKTYALTDTYQNQECQDGTEFSEDEYETELLDLMQNAEKENSDVLTSVSKVSCDNKTIHPSKPHLQPQKPVIKNSTSTTVKNSEKQHSILNFFSIFGKPEKSNLSSKPACESQPSTSTSTLGRAWSFLSGVSSNRPQTQPRTDTGAQKTQGSAAAKPQGKSSYNQNRQCPFYKKIPGTNFTVDAFRYGSIPGCTAYFLTHFHYDHYGGLGKKFSHPIYLSQITANLVSKRIKVAPQYLHTIALNTPTVVDGVEVTFMEANHCPGAVIILFKLPNGKLMLHTGDFRAHRDMESYPPLVRANIDTLYLDTTYCDPSHAFPPQEQVVAWAVSTAEDFVAEHPNTLIAVGSYTIGKERIFIAISEALRSKICVTREKLGILECLEDAGLLRKLTQSPYEARVHVMPMKDLNYQKLQEYLGKFKAKYDHVLAFEPTGWTHKKAITDLRQLKPKMKRDNIVIYGAPYSEHSSFTELKRFVQFSRPQKVLPTVNNGNPQSRRKMEMLFQSWLKEAELGISPKKQVSLDSWFKS